MSESTVQAGGNEFQQTEGRAPQASDLYLREDVFDARVVGLRADRVRRITMAGDVLALCASLALTVAFAALLGRTILGDAQLAVFVALLPLWLLLGNLYGLYRLPERNTDWSFADDLSATFVVSSIWGWFWLLAMSAIAVGEVLTSLALWAFSIAMVPLVRSIFRARLQGTDWYRQSVMVVGTPAAVHRVQRRIERQPAWCFDIVESIQIGGRFDPGARAASIAAQADAIGVGRVIIAEGPADVAERTRLIRDLLELGIYVDYVSSEADVFRSNAGVSHLEGLPTLSYSPVRLSPSAKVVKRTIDVVCASVLLVALSPLLAYIAIRIKLDSHGPVFFKQDRRGVDGTNFKLVKFRTMSTDAEDRLLEVAALRLHPGSATFKAANDPRVTRYGETLRRRSLDELPQLWNVIVGDMSLVGPRPLPLQEAAHVPPRYRARERVRPGLTGPWQVLGRSDIPFEDMIKLDYMYVSTWSPRGDLKLLLKTVAVVF
ncbi:MAG: exopolysaccharide biosynthesis polyprenyl glycosylphosphotransferase [Solirubrobacterales bacterium]